MKIQLPEIYRPLFDKHTYKVMYGGRGSAKSRSAATYVIFKALTERIGILCAREFERSIEHSLMQTLKEEIKRQNLDSFFRITKTGIQGANGSSIFFKGLRHNTASIKSIPNLGLVWLEEAENMSEKSISDLLPTIREDGAQLLVTFNPYKEDDPVYKRFVLGDLPNCWKQKINWRDNPYFTPMNNALREYDMTQDYDKYMNVWEGEPVKHSRARIFNNWRVDDLNAEIPKDERPYFGADWGFASDPTTLIKSYFINDKTLYISNELFIKGCPVNDLPAYFSQIPQSKDYPIVADSARPELISLMRDNGFHMLKARKGEGSVKIGIEWLKNKDIVLHPDCVKTIEELKFYSYKTDKRTEQILPIVEDKHNHAIDAIRYSHESSMKKVKSPASTVYSLDID
jgi:phage terminase large subunit